MKKRYKTLLTLLSMLLIAVTSIFATMAYLTDSESVVNTFTVGNVNITLDEAKVNPKGETLDKDGQVTSVTEEIVRVKENTYHLIPGQTYTKDPMITVAAGSESSYIRMLVTINQIGDLQTIFGDDFLPQNYVTGWDSTVWQCVKVGDVVDDTITYEFRYKETVDASAATDDVKLEPLFTHFTLPGELTGEELALIYSATDENDRLKITIIGHAIQAAGFETADDAWAKFDAQYAAATPPAPTIAPTTAPTAEPANP